MEYARSLYSGGLIVSACDINDYESYRIQGLRCLLCGEEVFLKSGEVRRKHFSHFESNSQSTSCDLRQDKPSSGSFHGINFEDKGQRRILFQKHFLALVEMTHAELTTPRSSQSEEFRENFIKDDNTCGMIQTGLQAFHEKSTDLLQEKLLKDERDLQDDYVSLLHFLITIEALDYIFNPSSLNVFKKILTCVVDRASSKKILNVNGKNLLESLATLWNEIVWLLHEVDWNRNLQDIERHSKPKCPWCKQEIWKKDFQKHIMFECLQGRRRKHGIVENLFSPGPT